MNHRTDQTVSIIYLSLLVIDIGANFAMFFHILYKRRVNEYKHILWGALCNVTGGSIGTFPTALQMLPGMNSILTDGQSNFLKKIPFVFSMTINVMIAYDRLASGRRRRWMTEKKYQLVRWIFTTPALVVFVAYLQFEEYIEDISHVWRVFVLCICLIATMVILSYCWLENLLEQQKLK